MRNFTVPVFGDSGLQVGEMPLGQGEARPLPVLRDVAAEQEFAARQTDELFRKANPALHAARQQLQRCQRTSAQWADAVGELRSRVSLKAGEMTGTSPDAPLGLREERQQELIVLRSQLAEAEEEFSASNEEQQRAQQAVDALVQVNA